MIYIFISNYSTFQTVFRLVVYKADMSLENLFFATCEQNNKDADQPLRSHSLISVIFVRCLDSIIPILVISTISRL